MLSGSIYCLCVQNKVSLQNNNRQEAVHTTEQRSCERERDIPICLFILDTHLYQFDVFETLLIDWQLREKGQIRNTVCFTSTSEVKHLLLARTWESKIAFRMSFTQATFGSVSEVSL